MNKAQQQEINDKAYHIYHEAMQQYYHEPWKYFGEKRLRTCSAVVIETTDYYILKSYETCICIIDKATGEIADVLRGVYGYTSTSAHHISKFIHDYTPYPWNNTRYTYITID